MSTRNRRNHSPQFKARVALDALKEDRTANEIASHHGIHPSRVGLWKKIALERLAEIFENGRRPADDKAELIARLYQQIGKLQVELDGLKKKLGTFSIEELRRCIEPHPQISIRRQCALLGVSRGGLYYTPAGPRAEDLEVMRCIDEQYTRTPFYGSRRMVAHLRGQGLAVNRKRVQRLMQQMGLQAIYPKPRLSASDRQHKVYPYLLRGVVVSSPDQVWSTDITYIRLRAGFIYLVAILDGFSRYVLAWRLSNTLDGAFCLEALEEALSGRRRPGIFNSDQGVQFTSLDFTGRLEREGIRVSMDGRGRVFDNIFIERLWRSVKYEEVYPKDYEGGAEARCGLGEYFKFYNQGRPHQAIGYKTPEAVYFGRVGRSSTAVRGARRYRQGD